MYYQDNQLSIYVTRLHKGDYGFWAEKENGQRMDASYMKSMLFAWHTKSLYGTAVEIRKTNNGDCLCLSPWETMDYLSSSGPLVHLNFVWSPELEIMIKTAVLYRQMLLEGNFKPSYNKWCQGLCGFQSLAEGEIHDVYIELLEQAVRTGIDWLEQWLDDILFELIHNNDQVRASWMTLEQDYPTLLQSWSLKSRKGSLHPSSHLKLDEEEWLIHIGWKIDDVPFRTALQLVEPDEVENGRWKLQLVLSDLHDSHHLVTCHLDGFPLEDNLPEQWQEPLIRRLPREMDKWINIEPQLVDPNAPERLKSLLTDEEAWRMLEVSSIKLVQAGCQVYLPSWWEQLKKLNPKLKAQVKSSVGSSRDSILGVDQIVSFDWKVSIGDVEITEAEFRRLAEQKKRFIHFKGRWIQLDPEWIAQMQLAMKQVGAAKGLSFREVMELHLLGGQELAVSHSNNASHASYASYANHANLAIHSENTAGSVQLEVELNSHLKKLIAQLDQTSTIPKLIPPEGLQAELRHYQEDGVSWLVFLRRFGLGGCLADDMGLGKTIQFIAYLMNVKAEAGASGLDVPALLICPTSVIGNWQKELQRFAPTLQVHVHYGPQRTKGEQLSASLIGVDLVITSYTLAVMDEEDLALLQWNTICLDEAQNIKNNYTKQAAAVRKLKGAHRIALTGTPIENRLTELWSIFDFLNPGYLGNLSQFNKRFVNAIERNRNTQLIGQVQKLIKPFLLRRVKKDPAIQLDLPDKFEAKTYVSLTTEQASLYEIVVQDLLDKIDTLSSMERRGIILATLTKLKQICNHPAVYIKEKMPVSWRNRSGKLTRLLEMVAEVREEGEKCLLFTQYVETGHLLQAALQEELHEKVQFLHGGVPKAKRDELIDRFQDTSAKVSSRGEQLVSTDVSTRSKQRVSANVSAMSDQQVSIFILSLKAGGTGLNLTAANHVFHYDRWWNPAVENQATDRAFRIGQYGTYKCTNSLPLGHWKRRSTTCWNLSEV